MAINLASTPPPPAGMLLQCWYPITMLANPHVCAPRTPSVRLFARVRVAPCMFVCARCRVRVRASVCVCACAAAGACSCLVWV